VRTLGPRGVGVRVQGRSHPGRGRRRLLSSESRFAMAADRARRARPEQDEDADRTRPDSNWSRRTAASYHMRHTRLRDASNSMGLLLQLPSTAPSRHRLDGYLPSIPICCMREFRFFPDRPPTLGTEFEPMDIEGPRGRRSPICCSSRRRGGGRRAPMPSSSATMARKRPADRAAVISRVAGSRDHPCRRSCRGEGALTRRADLSGPPRALFGQHAMDERNCDRSFTDCRCHALDVAAPCLVRWAITSRGNSAIRIYTVVPSKLWPEGYDHVERARARNPGTRGAGHDLQKT
jgi:hypothetical protein